LEVGDDLDMGAVNDNWSRTSEVREEALDDGVRVIFRGNDEAERRSIGVTWRKLMHIPVKFPCKQFLPQVLKAIFHGLAFLDSCLLSF